MTEIICYLLSCRYNRHFSGGEDVHAEPYCSSKIIRINCSAKCDIFTTEVKQKFPDKKLDGNMIMNAEKYLLCPDALTTVLSDDTGTFLCGVGGDVVTCLKVQAADYVNCPRWKVKNP